MTWQARVEVLDNDRGAWRIIHVRGDIDVYDAARFRACLVQQIGELVDAGADPAAFDASLCARRSAARLVVDLGEVDFIDSAGLGVLTMTYRDAKAAHVDFCLVTTSHAFLRLLTLTGLDQVLNVYASQHDITVAVQHPGDAQQ